MKPVDFTFWFTAALSVSAAVATVLARTPLRSALSLLVNIAALALLFLSLHAQLLAAVQLIVYAGAVVVLFVFVIMVIGPSADHNQGVENKLSVRIFSGALVTLLFFSLASIVATFTWKRPALQLCKDLLTAECEQFGGVERVASILFGQAAVPFELASILLLVAILGAFAVARGRISTNSAARNEWR